MNTITQAEREKIYRYAARLIKLDPYTGAPLNFRDVEARLMRRFKISRDRARGATAKAAGRKLHALMRAAEKASS